MGKIYLDATGALNVAFDYAKKHGLIIAAALLVFSLISQGMGSLFSGGVNLDYEEMRHIGERVGQGDMEALKQIGSAYQGAGSCFVAMLTSILQAFLYVGIYSLMLGIMKGRFTECTFDAFKLQPMHYVKAIVVFYLAGIIMGISLLLCVIPFFFVAPRVITAVIYQVDHPEADILESFKAAWKLSKGNIGSLLFLGILTTFLNFLGVLCCCIGVYFTEAIEIIALVVAYQQLVPNLLVNSKEY